MFCRLVKRLSVCSINVSKFSYICVGKVRCLRSCVLRYIGWMGCRRRMKILDIISCWRKLCIIQVWLVRLYDTGLLGIVCSGGLERFLDVIWLGNVLEWRVVIVKPDCIFCVCVFWAGLYDRVDKKGCLAEVIVWKCASGWVWKLYLYHLD